MDSISPLSLKEDWFIGDLIFPDHFGYVDILTHLGNNFGFIPKVRFCTEDFSSKLTMVGDGHGIAGSAHLMYSGGKKGKIGPSNISH